jgi:hypothetical protein
MRSVGKFEWTKSLEGLAADNNNKGIIKKQSINIWAASTSSGQDPVADSCEHGNQHPVS